MKTIKVQNLLWKKLVTMKIHLGCSTLDEVVSKLVQIVERVDSGQNYVKRMRDIK